MKKYDDYKILFLSLGTAFIFVYFIPASLNKFLFFIFIYLFYKSDKDYIWLAFILIIIEQPGGLFERGGLTESTRMPIFNIVPRVSISFEQIFLFTAFIKAIKKKYTFNSALLIKKKLIVMFIYFIFLIFIGIILGFNIGAASNIYKALFNLSLFYSVYCLFTKESDYVNFFRMLIPFGFIAFAMQLFTVSTGEIMISHFNPDELSSTDSYNIGTDNIRPVEMPILIAMLFFFTFYFILLKKQYFNRNVLVLLNIISFFSIFITATRSWFIMFVIFYILSFIFIFAKVGNMFIRYGAAGIIVILLLFSADLFVNQVNKALQRFSTIQLVAEGDITGGGTIGRYDIRAPRLMKAFYDESTIIFGAGFSETYIEKSDAHVGYHNLLFNTGIVGVILFAVFFGSIILNTIGINGRLKSNNPYKDVLKIFPIAIISIFFVNAGTQFYGYTVGFSRMFLLVFIIYFLNNQISCALQWEEESQ